MMRKRLPCFILSAAMAVSLLAAPAFASENIAQTGDEAEETIVEDKDGQMDLIESDEDISPEEDIFIDETDQEISDNTQSVETPSGEDGQTEGSDEIPETADEQSETVEPEGSGVLGSEYASSSVYIGEAVTEEDLAFEISPYAVSSYDTVKVKGTCNYDYAYQILDLVNEERAYYGLSELTMDTDLMDAAMQRAAETSIYWSHTRPSGKSCSTVSSKLSGENIAAGSSSLGPYFIMYGWMNSEGHRANILDSSYQSIGIGVFEMNGYIYWVQDFGTRSASTGSKSTGTASKTFSVEVNPDTIQSSLSLTSSTTSLDVGGSTTLTARIRNSGMSDLGNVYATIVNSSLKWSSSNTSAAKVDSSGKVTAVGTGSAKITAKTSGGDLSSSVTITCSAGELKKVNGVWGYYKNGTLQTSYTGFTSNSSGKWYVEKGIVTKSTNGVFKDRDGVIGTAGTWYYVTGSKVNTGFTGLSHYKNSSGWWYITKGKVDRSYTGLAKNQNGWFYVKNGKVDRSYTGFAKNSSGKWYVSGGKVSKTKNGVYKDKTGAIGSKNSWYYVLNSKVQTKFTGLANYSNASGWWYITNGKVDRSYNGLAKNKNGWFYLTNGKVNRSYTGLAKNSSGTWYVKSGKVQKSYTGTVTISGKRYSVTNGKVKA